MEAALFWIDCSMKKAHSFPQTASDQAPGGGESNRETCCPSPTGFLGFPSWNHSVKWRSSCQWQMAHMAGTGRILCSLEGPLISQYSRGTPPENCKQILITHEEFSLLDVEVGTTSQRHLAPCLAQSRHSINVYGWMNKLTWLERMCGLQRHCGSENTGNRFEICSLGWH